jgi:hypothetical protein
VNPVDHERGEHPDDLLSAHVDGELAPDAAARVAAHVAACAACREAEAELREARALLRALPPVEGRPVIEGFLARHRAVIRAGVAFVGVASILLAALALNASTTRARVIPDVEGLAAAHEQGRQGEVGDLALRPEGTYAAPPGLIGSSVRLSRHEVYGGTDLGAVVYRDGEVSVSVYQQPGRVEWGRLPPGTTGELAARPVWFGEGAPLVAVAERGDLVITVVSEDRAAVLTALGGFPEWRRTTAWDRIHDACQRFTQVFALGR